MKYIKKFENKKKFGEEIELVSYPEYDNIIVTKDEFEKLRSAINSSTGIKFDFRWDTNVDPEEIINGRWTFHNDELDEIEEWLELYRNLGDVESVENVKKYNI